MSTFICIICYEELDSNSELQAIRLCGHTFHGRCLWRWLAFCPDTPPTCPTCKGGFTYFDMHRLYLSATESTTPDADDQTALRTKDRRYILDLQREANEASNGAEKVEQLLSDAQAALKAAEQCVQKQEEELAAIQGELTFTERELADSERDLCEFAQNMRKQTEQLTAVQLELTESKLELDNQRRCHADAQAISEQRLDEQKRCQAVTHATLTDSRRRLDEQRRCQAETQKMLMDSTLRAKRLESELCHERHVTTQLKRLLAVPGSKVLEESAHFSTSLMKIDRTFSFAWHKASEEFAEIFFPPSKWMTSIWKGEKSTIS